MKAIRPAKLQAGDTVRIVAPSSSMNGISEEVRAVARQRFESLGLRVTFGQHVEESDRFGSSSVEARLQDLHDAFADPQVKGIFAVRGGLNSNQLLRGLDYELIAKHPKIFCGYSDITALGNAIWAKTGLIGYSGAFYSTLGMVEGLEYTLHSLQQCLFSEAEYEVHPSPTWSDDAWYRDQGQRTFHPNSGWSVLQEGEASGTIVGGNLSTLNLLQGTEYMPSLCESILFVEDDKEVTPEVFDRDLQSLLHLPDIAEVRGLVIGRFQTKTGMEPEWLEEIIKSKRELHNIPILANVDFGHTTPQITFPIGGQAKLVAREGSSRLVILNQ